MKTFFVSGIGTDVGKTVVASVLTHYHQADYWKPIQTGRVKDYDTLAELGYGIVHPSTHDLQLPASPHLAAEQEALSLKLTDFKLPQTPNPLVFEGAGGLLVPLNGQEIVGALHQLADRTYLVIKHYLGSINHSLLSLYWLQQQGVEVEIVISGDPHKPSERVIQEHTGLPITKYVPKLNPLNRQSIEQIAHQWTEQN